MVCGERVWRCGGVSMVRREGVWRCGGVSIGVWRGCGGAEEYVVW